MLARTEPVHLKVGAGAAEMAVPHAANLDLVLEAAARAHAKVRKKTMMRRQVLDPRRFLLRAKYAPIDLILIAGPPVSCVRQLDLGSDSASSRSFSATESHHEPKLAEGSSRPKQILRPWLLDLVLWALRGPYHNPFEPV